MMERSRSRSREAFRTKQKAAVLAVALLGLLSVMGGCFHKEEGEFKLAEAERRKISRFVSATGVLEPADPVYVASPVDATISSLEVQDGDYVEAGRILARLDEEELKESLASAKAAYQATGLLNDIIAYQSRFMGEIGQSLEAAYRHLALLVQEMRSVAGMVVDAVPLLFSYLPPETRDEARQTYESLRRALQDMQNVEPREVAFRLPPSPPTAAGASAASREAAGYRYRRLLEALKRPYLVSPVAGHVVFLQPSAGLSSQLLGGLGDLGGLTSVLASFAGFVGFDFSQIVQGPQGGELREGSRVAAGSPVFQVVDLREMRVKVEVEEADALQVKKGQKVRAYIDALPGKTFTGVVESVGVKGERGSGGNTVFPVMVRLDRTEEDLRIGLNATVDLEVESRDQSVAIPFSAVAEVDGRNFVYVVVDDKAVLREIQIGIREKDLVEVTSGLEEGEVLVVEDIRRVKEGMRVR